MTTANFDPSIPGTPYVRVDNMMITFPPPGHPEKYVTVNVHQMRAVPLTDGTAIEYQDVGNFQTSIDIESDLTQITFPMVNIENDTPLPYPDGNLGQLVLMLVSYVRSLQRTAAVNN